MCFKASLQKLFFGCSPAADILTKSSVGKTDWETDIHWSNSDAKFIIDAHYCRICVIDMFAEAEQIIELSAWHLIRVDPSRSVYNMIT